MFIRKYKNRSGSVSVQIIAKEKGKYQVLETLGTAKNPEEIETLFLKAQIHLRQKQFPNQPSLMVYPDELMMQNLMENLGNSNIHTIGPELVFGKLFDKIGFSEIKDKLFRHIVIARLTYPTSKLKTVDYLLRYQGLKISADSIYRFLDKLHHTYKDQAESIAFQYTRKILKGIISVVFYDLTTLYFEAEDEDDLRKIGFSKDGKFQKPQIMLGLLTGKNGYPIGYDIFEGNTFEGHTLVPTLEKIQGKYEKYGFTKPIVVADSALMSKDNIENLISHQYQFIIGARIKNENKEIKKQILTQARTMKDGDSFIIGKKDQTKLIVTYSTKRAKKDSYNRERGLKKLQQKVKTGKLTKNYINNRGYNKFLKLKGKVIVTIDQEKISQDQQWDGLKGYLTNTELTTKEVIENYGNLWQIEQAFRISKTDLKVRPIYHYRQKRIEAHICIAFVAYTIYKELERILKKEKIPFSAKRACELTHNMYEIEYLLPKSLKRVKTILKMDKEQQSLKNVIEKNI